MLRSFQPARPWSNGHLSSLLKEASIANHLTAGSAANTQLTKTRARPHNDQRHLTRDWKGHE